MTPLFPAQRAAEEFDKALGGTATQAVADRYAEPARDGRGAARPARGAARAPSSSMTSGSRLMTAAETELVAAPNVVRLAPERTSGDPAPARHRGRLPRHRRRHRRHGRRRLRCPARRRALPDQARRGAGRHRRADRATPAKGEALLEAGQPPASTRSARSRRRARPIPSWSRPPSTPSASADGAARRSCSRPTRPRATRQDITTVRDFTAEQMADVADARHEHLDPATDELPPRRRRHPGRHRPAGARPVRHLRPGRQPSLRPRRSAAGAGAATVGQPARAARSHRHRPTSTAAEAARIAALKARGPAAEARRARSPSSTATPAQRLERPARPRATPVTSTLTPDGTLVPLGHERGQRRSRTSSPE